ncbi:M20 aminoacylase family protein [Uliginosibacterium sp. H3]|uniref:M20 aminoacylase family protein n=1 Tax=Uliginosibacterium silvisoli TaxID=3114758 RepID=A0ABU6K5S9_9RHOO|nr:M20 aminoacylase family protein [Uliginosibacterium sp. H3]
MFQIIPEVAARADAIGAIRRDIHAHPELAFDEHRTAALVAERLEALGIETHRGIGQTGVVGVIHGKTGASTRAIALRADMDALPIQERNVFEHRSQHEGRMHACGHDGHTAMLLGAAEYLAQTRNFDGTVVLVFQPAEEGQGGGAAMIADGFFERFPVEAVFGMHNWPGMATGRFGVTPGPMMASADRFDIIVKGHGAHAAMPHQGVDPLVAAAHLVQAFQTIVSRITDPLDAAVVSVTQFHAGDAYNVIPGDAHLCGTVRALTAAVRAKTRATMQRICEGVELSHGVKIDFQYHDGYPPTVNTLNEAQMCREVAAGIVGAEAVDWSLPPSMGAEDFAYFLEKRPGCYVWLGNGAATGGEHGACMLHNARYDFNDEVIPLGVTYWVRLAEHYLAAR